MKQTNLCLCDNPNYNFSSFCTNIGETPLNTLNVVVSLIGMLGLQGIKET